MPQSAFRDERRRRVFVVDDEQNIASTLALILKHNGYDATAFFNPEDALSALPEHAPELVISDVVMPQMTGIELALRLRADHQRCEVLLFSGQAATSALLEEARRNGHEFEVLTKPMRPQDLLSRIEAIFSGTRRKGSA